MSAERADRGGPGEDGPAPGGRIVIDCDPGHDDAVALLLAAGSPSVQLAGITTVGGNQTLERVTRNARTIATVGAIAGVPIVAGAAHPLLRPVTVAAEIHGESGLDGPAPVTLTAPLTPGHGAQFLAETVLADPGQVTVVATGPLTNLALALRLAPEVAGAVRRVVLMGGSYTRGNVTAAAEFNIHVDPEAAQIVFEADWDVTMIGLDVTHQALFSPDVQRRLRALPGTAARWMDELMAFFTGSYQRVAGLPSPPVHDPVAVACVIDPSLVEVRDALVQVETTGRLTSGMTVVDFREPGVAMGNMRPLAPSRHHVAVGLDAERFWELVLDALATLGGAESAGTNLKT